MGLAFQPAAAFAPVMDAVYSRLKEDVASVPGAMVEHNKFCVSVHFRNCEPGESSCSPYSAGTSAACAAFTGPAALLQACKHYLLGLYTEAIKRRAPGFAAA